LFRCAKYAFGFVLLGFLFDVLLHFGAGVRLAMSLVLAFGFAGLLGWSWYLAWVRKNQLEHIARLLEERDPALGSKLINVLQLQGHADDEQLKPLTRELTRQAIGRYAEELGHINFERLARTPQLRREIKRAAWVAAAFAVLLILFHRVSVVEVARFADPFGDHPPYSFTQLAVLDPGAAGTNVIYGRSFLVRVKTTGHRPKEVFLTAQPVDHPEQAVTLPMFDKGSAGFHQQLENIRAETIVYAHTKDGESVSRKHRIGVILVPQLDKAYVQIAPPAYTGIKPEEKPYSFKGVQALYGSEVRFRLQSNRPLCEGAVEFLAGDTPPQVVKLRVAPEQLPPSPPPREEKAGERRPSDNLRSTPLPGPLPASQGEGKAAPAYEVVGTLAARDSGRLRFSLTDADGIPSQENWEGALTVTHDLPPEIRIVDPPKDCFVAMDFKVQAQVEATDDYGLKTVRLHRALNGVYSAPKVVNYDAIILSARETLDFNFKELGVQPGDIISFFGEAIDTSPEAHLAHSETVSLVVISVEDYNNFLREQSDLADIEGKYTELMNQLHDLVEDQKKLGSASDALKDKLAKADAKQKDALQQQLDGLLAKQNELNQKLGKQAERMENFVRKDPLYDVEAELQETLRRQADAIRESTKENNASSQGIAQRSSPAGGARQMDSGMLSEFKQASDEQVKKLGGVEEQARQDIAQTLQDMSQMQEIMKDFNQFEALFQVQQALTEQTRAYNRAGELSREDQLALKSLAATEKQVGDLMEKLEQKLREDSKAADKLFPKAAQSAGDLADKMEEARMQQLARQATGQMLASKGEGSFQSAERLRSEMEKLFGQCQSPGGQPGPEELDKYLRLTRSMNPGRNFQQMAQSRKFGRPGTGRGRGQMSGQGEGQEGTSGYAVMTGDTMNVMGNESFVMRSDATSKQSSKNGLGKGTEDPNGSGLALDKSDVMTGLNAVNRQSGAVQSETLIEEYSDVVENYFKTITKQGGGK
jgi:hypothetical protein